MNGGLAPAEAHARRTTRSPLSRFERYVLHGAILVAASLGARGSAQSAPHARVIIESAEVRSGPGFDFRTVYVAGRGEGFPVRARSTQGYFLQVVLPDSTLGWIAGDSVHSYEITVDEPTSSRFLGWLFAPPPLPDARGEIALAGGMLGSGGMIALRPSLLLAPAFGFELSGAAVVASGGRLMMASAGPILNLFPRSPVVPFVTLQGGVTASSPNADTFLLDAGAIAAASAGIGLRIGFHHRVTLRIETRTHVFFEPDRTLSMEEYCAGLTVFY
jgi:hypothetical protein